jgi:ubiquinone/menaquinone biosynthesis C-methylase UbiE
MGKTIYQQNERRVARAFDSQSASFDKLFAQNTIVQYKRKRVRDRVLKLLRPGSRILELNSGTGDDAIFFAKHGYDVHATDISEGMQKKLAEKVSALGLDHRISREKCSFTELADLRDPGPYDMIFSNFAGLNCTGDLDRVLGSFDKLLKPEGLVLLVVLPGFCLWETLMLFRGKFKTAFRRFFSSGGRRANIQGVIFTCWYYNPGLVRRLLEPQFDMISLEGLCTIVPPSYIDGFAESHPRLFSWLRKWERRLKYRWPFNRIGDYYIIAFRKKS